jgi:hypothetical protein
MQESLEAQTLKGRLLQMLDPVGVLVGAWAMFVILDRASRLRARANVLSFGTRSS